MKFDMSNRTAYDASISSGLAIMAVNRRSYTPSVREKKDVVINLKTYKN
jgi:hypothetical protein